MPIAIMFFLLGLWMLIGVVVVFIGEWPELMTKPRLQRNTAIFVMFLFAIAATSWTAEAVSFIVHGWYGGSPVSDSEVTREYFVTSHGKQTAVTRDQWLFVRQVEFWCGKVSFLVFIVSGLLLSAVKRFAARQGWSDETKKDDPAKTRKTLHPPRRNRVDSP